MPVLACPGRRATLLWGEGNQGEGPFAGILRPRVLVSLSYSDAQERVRECILGGSFLRNSVAFAPKTS